MTSSFLLVTSYDISVCTVGSSLPVASKYTVKESVAIAPVGFLTGIVSGDLKAKVCSSLAIV